MGIMTNTRKIVCCAAGFIISLTALGQGYQQSNDNPSMLVHPTPDFRREIITPEVNGYQVVKADLHVHTIYSDGHISPEHRIKEAWIDGLDAIAITDHLEYRPCEKKMIKFLDGNVTRNEVEKGKPAADLNYPVSIAASQARHRGITLIPGAEITRNPKEVGHFNVLFTKDNNQIYDPDPLQSLRNARKQGAIIQHNHPGWRKTDNEFTPVMNEAVKEGLIDGIEIFNTEEFYPDVIEKAVEKGYFVAGGTDIHSESDMDYFRHGFFRDMTLIFAKDASAESIREALENGRTLAYGYGNIAGGEKLLEDFFRAAVSVKVMHVGSKGKKYLKITNNSSFPFVITINGGSPKMTLNGLNSFHHSTGRDDIVISVANMWYGTGKHPEIKFKYL